jgi:hypothetical protein
LEADEDLGDKLALGKRFHGSNLSDKDDELDSLEESAGSKRLKTDY